MSEMPGRDFDSKSYTTEVVQEAEQTKLDSVKFWPGNPLSYTTTKIDVYRNDIALSTGTGFVMSYGQSYVLVTNWHVLSGFNPTNGKCLSDTGAIPNRIEFHVTVSRKSVTAERKPAEILYFKPLKIAACLAG
jgi:hypothetical protein